MLAGPFTTLSDLSHSSGLSMMICYMGGSPHDPQRFCSFRGIHVESAQCKPIVIYHTRTFAVLRDFSEVPFDFQFLTKVPAEW